MLLIVNFEYLLKESVELVRVRRGPTTREGGVPISHGGGGKGVATKLNGLTKRVAPELMFTCIKTEGGGAHR